MTLFSADAADARAAFIAGALRCAPVALGVLAYGLVQSTAVAGPLLKAPALTSLVTA